MKIQVCSDLHLEFDNNRQWLKANPLIPKAETLIIAGDTYYLGRDFEKLDFIKKVSKDFKRVYLIPGNHEYYDGYDVATALEPTCQEIADNVFLVNNHVIELENIKFIFSTMWSKIQRNILEIMRGMMDFRAIKFGGERFTVNQFNELHKYAFDFISNEINKEGRKVVITHHLPSIECNIEELKETF